jgi:hypothetical protein
LSEPQFAKGDTVRFSDSRLKALSGPGGIYHEWRAEVIDPHPDGNSGVVRVKLPSGNELNFMHHMLEKVEDAPAKQAN